VSPVHLLSLHDALPISSKLGSYQQTNATRGYNSSCADGWVSMPLTPIMQGWADDESTDSHGLILWAASETNNLNWKRFLSRNTRSGEHTSELQSRENLV